MNVLIYGCGSMGSKRATILTNLGHNIFLQDPPKGKMSFPDSTDAVFICTPPETHLQIAKQNLGHHMFIEKPLATSFSEASWFVSEFEQTGKVGAVGYNWKYHPKIKELKKKKFNRLILAELKYFTFMGDWQASYLPNKLLETHEIELSIYLFGEPKTKPSLERDYNKFTIWMKNHSRVYNQFCLHPFYSRSIYILEGRKNYYTVQLPKEDVWDTYVAETKHFMQCVAGDRRVGPPLTSMRDGLRTLAIVEQCALSA